MDVYFEVRTNECVSIPDEIAGSVLKQIQLGNIVNSNDIYDMYPEHDDLLHAVDHETIQVELDDNKGDSTIDVTVDNELVWNNKPIQSNYPFKALAIKFLKEHKSSEKAIEALEKDLKELHEEQLYDCVAHGVNCTRLAIKYLSKPEEKYSSTDF